MGLGPEMGRRGADHVELLITTAGFVQLSSAPETPLSLSLYLFLTISPSPGRLNGRKRDSPTESGTVTAAAGTRGSSQVSGSRVSRRLQLLTGKTSHGQVRVEGTQDSGLGSQSLVRCPRIGHLTSFFFS